VFPEGTRSIDGEIQAFKKGPFVLAVDAGVPILPVVINGTWSIMPKNRLTIKPRSVTLDILPPFNTSEYDRATKDQLMDKTRYLLCQRFNELKGGSACS
jgi:1-acyl-sn-glycerol-3-phosphate acyltransferase